MKIACFKIFFAQMKLKIQKSVSSIDEAFIRNPFVNVSKE